MGEHITKIRENAKQLQQKARMEIEKIISGKYLLSIVWSNS